VDDNYVLREIYWAVLNGAGYEVDTAADGCVALKKLEAQDRDLLILDIEMPNMTGWQLLEIMRGRIDWQDVPVILVTALVEPSAVALASSPRYNCYLSKKITGQELLRLVEQVLAEGTTAAAARGTDSWQLARPPAREDDAESFAPPEASARDLAAGRLTRYEISDFEETDTQKGLTVESCETQ
jgi:CheY-like chemotaxis protein